MAKICAIVFNTVSRDARVLKEAETLRSAGHDVTLVGLTDQQYSATQETLENGVSLLRVDGRSVTQRAWRLVIASLALLLLLAYSALFHHAREAFWWILAAEILAGGIILGYIVFKRENADPGIVDADAEDTPARRHMLAGFLRSIPIPGALRPAVAFLCKAVRKVYRVLRRAYRILYRMAAPFRPRRVMSKIVGLIKQVPGMRKMVSMIALPGKMVAMYFKVRQVRPEILHCHDVATLPVGILTKLTLGCTVVYDAHEIYEEVAQGSERRARIYRRIHRAGQGRIDGFITINDSIAKWYADAYPAFPPAVVIKNATRVAGPIDYDGRLHNAAGLPRDVNILLYQGGFSTKRGLEYLVESARYFANGWVLVMMGWGKLEPRLREIAESVNQSHRERGGKDAVVFIPPAPQRELAYWTAGGSVGIVPYEKIGLNHWFCTPNKLWEYPNASLPLLVSPFPELSAPIVKYQCGWLLPEDQSPERLGELISSLSSDEIARARANCSRFMADDNWDVYAGRLVDMYRALPGRT